jgi:DNA-binding CsgD family transcriptional regulator
VTASRVPIVDDQRTFAAALAARLAIEPGFRAGAATRIEEVLGELLDGDRDWDRDWDRDRVRPHGAISSLTARETEVLRCVMAGLSRTAIADRLFLSPHTVRTHLQNVLAKLTVHSTLAAVATARRAGLPPIDG